MSGVRTARRAWRGLGRLALRLALWAALALPAAGARAVIGVGETAPSFTLQGLDGQVHAQDEKTSGNLLLLFIKPEERYTTETLASLDHIFTRIPQLARNLRRWIVVSRIQPGVDLGPLKKTLQASPGWNVLLDEDDALYNAYRIIATPTTVLVGSDRRVKATHPGYDPGLEQDVRLALAEQEGGTLPPTATRPAAPPDLQLQMGRRLAALGIYDRALKYYEQALNKGPLPPEVQLELAEVYLGLNRPDQAIQTLQAIPKDSPAAARVGPLLEQANKLKAGHPEATPRPPRIQSTPTTFSAQVSGS